MNPPAGIDMSLIREAMARRAQGGGVPATQQVSQPAGGSPLQAPPQVQPTGSLQMQGQPQQQPMPTPEQQQSQAGGQGQAKQPVQVDDQTKAISKALIAKLMQVL